MNKYLMPRINILPLGLRNKIAAGEVIERPASVVKELIENSIDAMSTSIKIEALGGGKGLITVSDNGSGMDKEDALLCIQPHATSKLVSEEDLFNIRTLGFRGEALPSIASVSKMRLFTGLKESGAGVLIDITGGEVREVRDSPAQGTAIEIRDLFFNTPARKKFLKTNSTETFHIVDTVTKEALSHPDIGFRLLTENNETMNLPPASGLRERIMQVYGQEFLEGLTEAEANGYGIKLTAFITQDNNFRNSRNHQFIFINKRPVKDQAISHAIYRGYEGIMPKDKHPVFFLYLELDPKTVDFNVHPTKREVRFEDKETIYQFVISSISGSLKKQQTSDADTPVQGTNDGFTEPSKKPSSYDFNLQPGGLVSENMELGYTASLSFIYIGDSFVAFPGKDGVTLMDYHAAHERILYEKLLKGIGLNSHQLLFPAQVRLSPKDYMVLIDKKDTLYTMGIEIDDFGKDSLIVRSLPEALKGADINGILSDVASAVIEKAHPFKSLKENIAARIACHSSVRGRAILKQEELKMLISGLEKTEHPGQCPHGRPTKITLSLDDLKKMFKRK